MAYWRDKSSAVIQQLIQQNPGADEKTLRTLISQAYPYGQREHHPYKIWLDEVKKAMPRKFPKPFGRGGTKLTLRDTKGTLFEGWSADTKGTP